MRIRLDEIPQRCHEDRISAKETNSLNLPQALKIPDAIAGVEKEWAKLKKIPAWQPTNQKRERRDRWSKNVGQKTSFRTIDGSVSSQEFGVRTSTPKVQRSSCTPMRYCERWFWILCGNHWTWIISITNDSSQSHGYHLQTAGLRTSNWRNICWNTCKNGICSKIIWISSPRIIVQYRRPSFSSRTKSVRHPLVGLLWEKTIWESFY